MEKQRTPLEEQKIHFEAIVTLIQSAEKVIERAEHLKDGFNHKPFAEMVDANVNVLRAQADVLRPLLDSKTVLSLQQMLFIRESAATVRRCMEQLDTNITLMTQHRNSKMINIGGLGNGR